MRILIGNHIDISLLSNQGDLRMYIHRIFWLAQENDIVILPCPPDEDFVYYVTNLLQIKRENLKILTINARSTNKELFDHQALFEQKFLNEIAKICHEVTEIIPLWPAPQIARFAQILSKMHIFPGASFFLQGGDAISNSKCNFRAFAATLKCPIAPGAVCRTADEAASIIKDLLKNHPAVVIKQDQNSAGAGNQLVYKHKPEDSSIVGLKFNFAIKGDQASIRDFLEQRWDWATGNQRFPAIIEAYIPGGKTVYAEFYASDQTLDHLACGSLEYENGKLVREAAPLRWLPYEAYNKLITEGYRLAELYRQLGYRGYLSADALYTKKGKIIFTEMNARIGGSPHIYQTIADQIVNVYQSPYRSVTQFLFNPLWNLPDTRSVLQALQECGLTYEPQNRRGIILSTPPIGITTKPFMFCIIHELGENPLAQYHLLDNYLLTRANND